MSQMSLAKIESAIETVKAQMVKYRKEGKLDKAIEMRASYFVAWLYMERKKLLSVVWSVS